MAQVVRQLYEQAYDFPYRLEPPRQRYMVAAIPRSGSTFLCINLWRTGALGAPMEYLNLPVVDAIVRRLGEGDVLAYWEQVRRRRTSPNGVFGFKAFVSNYTVIADGHPELLPRINSDEVIYLTRRDKLSQAVSYARAWLSRVWFAGIDHEPPAYDPAEIAKALHLIEEQERQWETIFDLTGVRPLRLAYEDVLADPDAACRQAADRLGVDLASSSRLSIPMTERQADATSDLWKQRWRMNHPEMCPAS